MKAWIVSCESWGVLLHAETAGKAKYKALNLHSSDYLFTDFKAIRIKDLDNKIINYQNATDAGFLYYDDYDGHPISETEFINDCRCPICREEK